MLATNEQMEEHVENLNDLSPLTKNHYFFLQNIQKSIFDTIKKFYDFKLDEVDFKGYYINFEVKDNKI